ncbi:hypothetical protein [Gracilibacillus alcaliphilus]|uniref:hypothetical protein n=1 Tax=Gracilibacillus alcaliphilus TaxID=1401441 RepID=UPI00195AEE01|nr:hypothetical protein [Gracilibacillus alcaliphilus]MBM7679270.1 hypothetical protein [Gracilibacillus alcaliphilus]
MKATIQLLRFLRKSRAQKKKKLYQQAVGVAFDWVIMIYLAFFAGLGVFIGYGFIQEAADMLLAYQSLLASILPVVLLGIVLSMIGLSFYQPGIAITSTEWKLTSLPFTMEHIWLLLYLRAIAHRALLVSVIFFMIFILTPYPLEFVLPWYSYFLLAAVLTLLPQWYIFQIEGWRKLLFCLVGFVLIIMARLLFAILDLDPTHVFILALALLHVYLWPRRLTHINWQKVMEKNDEKVWNITFVNYMSGNHQPKIKRHYFVKSLFASPRRKQPFDYQDKMKVMRKLWWKSFEQEVNQVAKFISSLLGLVIVLLFLPSEMQGIMSLVIIFLFVTISTSFFLFYFKIN